MYTIAFAYAGSGSNNALRKLLHVAVSDVADDVRRALTLTLTLTRTLTRTRTRTRTRTPTPTRTPTRTLTPTLSPNPNPNPDPNQVRRAAVTAIGFVLAATPAQCPKVGALLPSPSP